MGNITLFRNLGPELITNGDMELNSTWIDDLNPDINEQSSDHKHSGTYSWHLASGPGVEGGMAQQIADLVIGGTYELSFWYYCIKGRIRWVVEGPTMAGTIQSPVIGTWTNYITRFIGAARQGGGLIMCFYKFTTEDFECYFDDVSLKMVI